MSATVLEAEVAAPRREADLAAPPAPPAAERIRSIDVIRGLNILVMIFVNDLAGVIGAPGWMKHIQPPNADGMTFVDVVFPAFLFIVGLSIPIALEKRLARGALGGTLRHIGARVLGLLVLGVFMVNAPRPGGVLSPHLWSLLVYLAAMAVWVAIPPEATLGARARLAVRLGGAAALAALALLFHGSGAPRLIELQHSWWGILGLIGWAYLMASAFYLVFRGNVAALLGGVVLLYGLFIADAAGAFTGLTWITGWVSIGSMLGSHAALTLSGAVFGAVLLPTSPVRGHAARIRWALGYALFLFAAAWLLHSAADVHKMFIVNKIAATPAWCLYSAAITMVFWVVFYWLLDVRGHTRGTTMLERAGQNALLAYILAPIAYYAMDLAASAFGAENPFGMLGESFWPGFTRAVLFALAMTWGAAWARNRKFVLKL
ncbi:MAG TPA: DUF5009 domain-containing protein [Longimicrobiales bacterium]